MMHKSIDKRPRPGCRAGSAGSWTARAILVVVLVLAAATIARAGVDPLRVPLPVVGRVAGVQTAWIARHMVRNGIPMSIQSFKARMPAGRVLKRYKKWLTGHGAAHARIAHTKGLHTLGAGVGHYFVSIQGRDKLGSGSAGYIVVSPMPGLIKPQRKTSLPVPQEARVINDSRYRDGNRMGESVTLISSSPPADMIAAVAHRFTDAGWQRIDRKKKTGAGAVATLMFQRSHAFVQVAVQENQRVAARGSLILINWSKKS